jgi:23S rRNA (adenine2503-C2)-methyltransferase
VAEEVNVPAPSLRLSDYDIPGLRAQFERWGFPAVHAARLLRNFYTTGGCVDFAELKIGKELEAKVKSAIPFWHSHVVKRSASIDGTVKLLIGFPPEAGGGAVEAVLMPLDTPGRAAACVSSQIGCAMGCDFCASTKRGLERNLSSGEIVEQFLHLRAEALKLGRRLHTLVFMGMGEPMQNLENVMAAIQRIAAEDLGALGWRQITVSTVGIVPGIEQLANSGLNVNLALSLHAPDDETRAKIVPMNKRYPVAEIVAATKRFYEQTNRITNVEYCMLAGVNDSDAHARALAELLRGFRTHVNLIPYNAIGTGLSGIQYQPPTRERVVAFVAILRAEKVVVHLRKRRGDDVNAACGQLREMTLA